MIITLTAANLENVRKKLKLELDRMAPGTSKTCALLEREELKMLLQVLDAINLKMEIEI